MRIALVLLLLPSLCFIHAADAQPADAQRPGNARPSNSGGGGGGGGPGAQWAALAEQMNAAIQSGDLELAEQVARQRVAFAEGRRAAMQGNAYRNLGGVLSLRGRYTEAEVMLNKALPLIESDNGKLSSQAINALMAIGNNHMQTGRYAEADTALREALTRQLAYRPQHPDLLQAYNLLIRAQGSLARFAEADKLLAEANAAKIVATDRADRSGSEEWIAIRRAVLINVAGWLKYQERKYAEAEKLGLESLPRLREVMRPDHPQIAITQVWVGWAILQQQRYADAEKALTEAYAQALKVLGPRHREVGRAQLGLALTQAQQGNTAMAEKMMREALDNARRTTALERIAGSARTLAQTLINQKRPAEALPFYREAIGAVDKLFAQTRGLDDATRENFIGRYSGYYREALILLLNLHQAQPQAGYDRQALEVVSSTQSRLFTEMLRQADVGKFSSDQAFKDLKAKHTAIKVKVADLQRRRTLENIDEENPTQSTRYADPIVRQRMEGQLTRLLQESAAAEKELADVETTLWEKYPRYMELTQPRAVTADLLQKSLLKPGESLLCYYLLPNRLMIFVVEKERFRLIEVPKTRKQIADLVAAARKPETDAAGAIGFLSRLDPGVLHQLHEIVFAPVAPLLKKGQRLLVIGDGPLHTLPLEMLVTRWGDAEKSAFETTRKGTGPLLEEYGTLPYLASEYQFAYMPSLSALASLRLYRKAAPRYDRELVSFADPVFDTPNAAAKAAPAYSAGVRSVRSGNDQVIPRLPETADEAREIAAILGGRSSVFLRDAAQEHTAKSFDFKTTRYVHFATHGLLGGEFVAVRESLQPQAARPASENRADAAGVSAVDLLDVDPESMAPLKRERGQPALVLSLSGDLRGEDGLLTMSEVVETMDLNAQLVVLSACNTAGESDNAASGEGFAGLTRAFMYAGAQGLVVSHWSVESHATQEMMGELFQGIRKGSNNLAALDAARQKIRASTARQQAGQRALSRAHPYFWAPFVYVGD